MCNLNLFNRSDTKLEQSSEERLGKETYLLHNFTMPFEKSLLPALETVIAAANFRQMKTRRGFTMSVAMTNCGDLGWISDSKGYRYSKIDPITKKSWPCIPEVFFDLASSAAIAAGFNNFVPDACLINRYEVGAKMALHQDQDELDFNQPIVSISLGIPAIFLLGGLTKADKTQRILLSHGDVLVWGGADRLRFHGVLPIKSAMHPLFGNSRINLTFRKAH